MKTSCISHPEREPLVIIRKSQVEFCDGNQCAAAVVSYLEYWHNWKLDSDQYNKKSNTIAEMHGDPRSLSENVYQFHTLPEIAEGILNLYSTKVISEAIKFLENKKIISVHKNPNPRYHYDKTKYFCFYPEIYNSWLNARESRPGKNSASTIQKGIHDTEIFPHASGKNASPFGKNAAPITEINNKEFNQSIKRDDFQIERPNEFLSNVIDSLVKRGMPIERFKYPDTIETICRLEKIGATVNHFLEAYDLASQVATNAFGVNYLAKAVSDLLGRDHHLRNLSAYKCPSSDNKKIQHEPVYESDLSKGRSWLGDIIDKDE